MRRINIFLELDRILSPIAVVVYIDHVMSARIHDVISDVVWRSYFLSKYASSELDDRK